MNEAFHVSRWPGVTRWPNHKESSEEKESDPILPWQILNTEFRQSKYFEKLKPSNENEGGNCDVTNATYFISTNCAPFDSLKLLQLIEGKTISFIGDSLTQQMSSNLVLKLSNQIKKFEKNRFEFASGVVIQRQWLRGLVAELNMEFVDSADIIVFNIGAWFEDGVNMRNVLNSWGAVFSDFKGKVFVREYSPVHFDTFGGDYRVNQYDRVRECVPNTVEDFMQSRDSYRRSVLNEWAEENGHEIIQIFENSMEAHYEHIVTASLEKTDCRHWCIASSVMSSWNTIFYNHLVIYYS